MDTKDKDEKDRAAKGTKEPSGSKADDSEDEGELSPVKPKSGEPSDNLRRRGDWFQKRHGGG
jgi:hypothetical protein